MFTECQMISRLSYDIYNVPEGEGQVQNLSSKMIYNQGFRDQSRLLEQVYSEALFESIDLEDIKETLSQFTLEKCKVVLMAQSLLGDDCKVKLPEKVYTDVLKEEWFVIQF